MAGKQKKQVVLVAGVDFRIQDPNDKKLEHGISFLSRCQNRMRDIIKVNPSDDIDFMILDVGAGQQSGWAISGGTLTQSAPPKQVRDPVTIDDYQGGIFSPKGKGAMSIEDAYQAVITAGQSAPVTELSFFSHASLSGPLLVNSVDPSPLSGDRAEGDKDGRPKDFDYLASKNLLVPFTDALDPSALIRIWGGDGARAHAAVFERLWRGGQVLLDVSAEAPKYLLDGGDKLPVKLLFTAAEMLEFSDRWPSFFPREVDYTLQNLTVDTTLQGVIDFFQMSLKTGYLAAFSNRVQRSCSGVMPGLSAEMEIAGRKEMVVPRRTKTGRQGRDLSPYRHSNAWTLEIKFYEKWLHVDFKDMAYGGKQKTGYGTLPKDIVYAPVKEPDAVLERPTGGVALDAAISAALDGGDRARAFMFLRGQGAAARDPQVTTLLQGTAILNSDDKWLAGILNDPPTTSSNPMYGVNVNNGGDDTLNVAAHFFQGQSFDRRALVLAGVHGSEPAGQFAAEAVVTKLKTSSPPKFSTIVVPRLFGDSRYPKNPVSLNDLREVDDKYAKGDLPGTRVEPNRNFPLPGVGYDLALAGNLQFVDDDGKIKDNYYKQVGGQLKTDASRRMMSETRMLVRLMERFQPERIVSIHQHSVPGKKGNGPGVFVDVRYYFDRNEVKKTQRQAEEGEDQRLTREMLIKAIQKYGSIPSPPRKLAYDELGAPFSGNTEGRSSKSDPLNLLYSQEAVHPAGNSLGTWAPARVAELLGPQGGPPQSNRPGITTVTIEIPQYPDYRKSTDTSDPLIKALVDMYAELIIESFLS